MTISCWDLWTVPFKSHALPPCYWPWLFTRPSAFLHADLNPKVLEHLPWLASGSLIFYLVKVNLLLQNDCLLYIVQFSRQKSVFFSRFYWSIELVETPQSFSMEVWRFAAKKTKVTISKKRHLLHYSIEQCREFF